MRLDYLPGHTVVHRADIRSKLLAFLAVTVAVFVVRTVAFNAALAVATILTVRWLQVTWRALGTMLAGLSLVVACIVVFAVMSPPPSADPTVVFHLPGGWPVTVGGLCHAANLALRIITMVCASAVLLLSTPPDQFTTLLQRLRLPNPIVVVLVTAVRFVPTMQARAQQILDAQRARGGRVDAGGLLGRIRAYLTIMVPLFTSGIRQSDDLSAALVSRGYGVTKRPTVLRDLRWTWCDYLVSALAVLLIVSAVWTRLRGG